MLGTRILADGSLIVLRKSNKELIKELDRKYERLTGELRWYQSLPDIQILKNKYKDQTINIVGKGPSLDFLEEADLEGNPTIAINESIHKIEELTSDNVFCIQQDYLLRDSCKPKLATLLLRTQCKGYYLDYNPKFEFVNADIGISSTALTVEVAIKIAQLFGANKIRLLCFDASVNKNLDYANCVGHHPTGEASRFLKHKEKINKLADSLKIEHTFFTPETHKNFTYSTIAETIENLHSDKPVVFMPFLGELGWLVMWHIRMIDAFKASQKVVCCKKGEELLYPSADSFYYDWKDPLPDTDKSGSNPEFQNYAVIRKKFPKFDVVPSFLLKRNFEAEIDDSFYDKSLKIKAPPIAGPEIVFCCRMRKRAEQRNWKHWQFIADELDKKEITYGIVGLPETSYHLKNSKMNSWNFKNPMQTSIQMLQACKLYVGGDTGGSHLAALAGAPMLIFRYPSLGDYTHRMKMINRNFFKKIDAWHDQNLVLKEILNYVRPKSS